MYEDMHNDNRITAQCDLTWPYYIPKLNTKSGVVYIDDNSDFAHYFSLALSSWKLSLWIIQRIEMWVSTTSPPYLSYEIYPLTTEIFYRKGITKKTYRQTDTHTHTHTLTESDSLPIYDIRSRNESDTLPI